MTGSRQEFQIELDLLARRVEVLFGEVEHSTQRAVTALVEGDRDLAQATIAHDDLIDELTVSLEEAVIALIARQAPVASDLRYLLSVLRISSDLERVGDLALRVAKQVYDKTWISRSESLRLYIRRLGDLAIEALGIAAEGWVDRDAQIYTKLEKLDFTVDEEYARIVAEIRALQGPYTGDIAVHSLIASQALERIADHAVNIGHRIRFLVTGTPEGLVGEISP